MNSAYLHLLWKEYRAIRAFWLALVVLSLGLQWAAPAKLIVLNVALATPVFFAVGCIGTAFALEKEEGTYDWLQASPATDGQVFLAKLTLCVLGTAAMYAVLWPGALWITGGRLPEPLEWHGMLALWPLAALEAIAWSMLFSLRGERPLPAIVLALVVTSTVIHLAAMPYATIDFTFSRYLSAIPLRLAAILPVLIYDVYLGLRWLQPEVQRSTARPANAHGRTPQRATREAIKTNAAAHLHARDRSMLLGHLFWQHGRQAWRLMLLMVGLQIATTLLVRYSGIDNENWFTFFPLIGFAALMGSCVFLPDQERRSYRFFVEHNVPPRKVWLTRLVPWMAAATISALFVCYLWVGAKEVEGLLQLLVAVFSLEGFRPSAIWRGHGAVSIDRLGLPPLLLGLSAAALSFAGGQWISMLVRSGLLAGFFSLLLTAMLTIWVVACFVMQLSWLYFVIPILLILLLATWLRAPDWIAENSTWQARTKAASVVAIPGLLLAIAAPIVRVNQVPLNKLAPGFSIESYVAQITPTALAAGEVYKQANESLNADRFGERALELILKASAAPEVVLANPATLVDWPVVNDDSLVSVVNQSGDQLLADHQLAQALERYLKAFQVQSDLTNFSPQLRHLTAPLFPYMSINRTLGHLNGWGTHRSQTQELLRAAIAGLEKVSVNVLHTEDAIKSNYILCKRYIEGDDRLAPTLFGQDPQPIYMRNLLARFAPWEARREMRGLNLKAAYWLARTNSHSIWLSSANSQLASRPDDNDILYGRRLDSQIYRDLDKYEHTMGPHELTVPFEQWAIGLYQKMSDFEASRRASLIFLACRAYRQKHADLPQTLEDLIGNPAAGEAYFAALPVDPYTGRTFVYFRDGLPEPQSPDDRTEFHNWTRNSYSTPEKRHGLIQFGRPCLWSPGTSVQTQACDPSPDNPYGILYQKINGPLKAPDYETWARGEWFPISLPNEPKPQKKASEKQQKGNHQRPPSRDVDDLFKESDAKQDSTSDFNEVFKALDADSSSEGKP